MKKIYHWTILSLLLLSISACKPQPCGVWSFTGAYTPADGTNAYKITDAFAFNPANCNKTCVADQDCVIQLVVVFDTKDQTYVFASDQTQASSRVNADHWAIDRVDGSAYGYYGLQNDLSFYPGWNTPGSNNVSTMLFDEPSGWGANTVFYAFDVAVVYQSQNCANAILGYHFWNYSVDNNGVFHAGINTDTWQGMDVEFQNAVSSWNAWAPSSGTETDGTGIMKTNAVAFPTLTDL